MDDEPKKIVHRIIRLPKVEEITGISKSTIYSRMKQGLFPAPLSLGNRAVGWLEHEIIGWIESLSHAKRN